MVVDGPSVTVLFEVYTMVRCGWLECRARPCLLLERWFAASLLLHIDGIDKGLDYRVPYTA
jgi:hypothetical protein